MAHLFRLIALVLLLVSSSAHASFPATSGPDPTDSCRESNYPPIPGYTTNPDVTSHNWAWRGTNADDGGWEYWSATYGWNPLWSGQCTLSKPKVSSCPANATLAGTSCTCDTGYDEVNGSCVLKQTNSCTGLPEACAGVAGGRVSLEGYGKTSPPGCAPDATRPNCAQGCAAAEVGVGVSYQLSNGNWMTGQEYKYTGGVCTLPAPSDIPQKKDSDCAGSVGEINGIRTCVPNQAATGDTSSKTNANADGTTSKTDTSTTCDKGVCTTTSATTNKDSTGATTSTSTSSSSVSQREYCATNKSSTVCAATNGDKNPADKDGLDEKEPKSTFGGNCDGGFTCEGDGIQCAMAREQHQRACEMFSKKTAESLLYDGEVAKGRDRDVTKTLPGNSTENLSGKLSQDNVLGGGRCIPDMTVTVWRTSVTLPFSTICPQLEYMGWALVAIASLIALRIVAGSSRE